MQSHIQKPTKQVYSPNKLLQQIWQKADHAFEFLDLGAGQGRDSLFMARNGWHVVAVEKSTEAIEAIKRSSGFGKLPIEIHRAKVEDFTIEKNRYSIIQLFNVLQFVKRKKALEILAIVKRNVQLGGYIIVSGFTIHESSYAKHQDLCYFGEGELREIFYDFKIFFYRETMINDPGHSGKEYPHKHHVVRMVAQKAP
ncbi:MAG: methyltransferase domain-containing protein [Patescibacteria group bacterium]|nr:methyltransferase domain-containing protein [Patescibacteria group bacterium]